MGNTALKATQGGHLDYWTIAPFEEPAADQRPNAPPHAGMIPDMRTYRWSIQRRFRRVGRHGSCEIVCSAINLLLQPTLYGQWFRIVHESNNRYFDDVHLKAGISPSHTRFTLSNFCLNNFGADGQYLADLIDFCLDTHQLQEALNTIREEVRSRFPDRLPTLIACVRDANETAVETDAPAVRITPKVAVPPASRPPALRRAAGGTAMSIAPAAVPARAAAPRSVTLPQPSVSAATDPLQLKAGVSLAHARFVLSEFCLDQFSTRAQQFIDAIDGCRDVAALQKVLNLITVDIQERHRERLPKLIDCAREINETAD